MLCGKVFHIVGAAMQNSLLPKVLSDLPEGMLSNIVLIERRLYLMDT